MRWLVMAFCFAVAAVMGYWAYSAFDAISSDPDTAAAYYIVWGSILSLGSLAGVICGAALFVLWPLFRDRDPRPRWARRAH